MAIAKTPSAITLPETAPPWPAILDFLIRTFPHVPAGTWEARLRDGKLLDESGQAIGADTPYIPGRRLFYFREVASEPVVPFREEILFRNDEILVADKPHFLPSVPGGRYVNECLEQRLRECTGNPDLVVLHRLDRETAGLVLCSVNPDTRGRYHDLFRRGSIEKTYEAVATVTTAPRQRHWRVENRIVRGTPRFRMQIVPGAPNARSLIELLDATGERARFRLQPLTGKTHQLRLHLASLGFPILHDRYYPELEAERADDFSRPLQLLAGAMRFTDPVTGRIMEFQSERTLGR